MTALFIFPASLLRPVGGWLSDHFGPRMVTYSGFVVMTLALAALCVPDGTYLGLAYHLGPTWFTTLMVVVGSGMGIGKASVYKSVPDDFPNDVGAVGGLVGMLGGLGGFLMPPLFGALGRMTGSPRSAFVTILVLTVVSLAWLHASARPIKTRKRQAQQEPFLEALTS
jgi:NNP family nitrate/nitrite transporter-like MFS transporter